MSRIKKRFEKFMNNPVGVKWDQLVTIIEHYGLKADLPKDGSHWMVYHPEDIDNTMIPVPVHNNRVKVIYVKRIINLLCEVIDDEEE
ncbi:MULTISPECIES: hypothetical protein [Paenibacillus]|uniref:hypothetical protein n=1 Tax=Paenibacillus TaxID=44249 RepID=UPI00096D6FF6|nr:hypothetical protein [Paenibacillus odorifer]OMD10024.1 hypothetical protein BJP50_28940 [Paenibacillus odorifer]